MIEVCVAAFPFGTEAHFNLVVRRKRFELVFHADTDIHRTRYSLLIEYYSILDTGYSIPVLGSLSVAFPIDLVAGIAASSLRLKISVRVF